jgi:hypothetical protein
MSDEHQIPWGLPGPTDQSNGRGLQRFGATATSTAA